jgi:hypothetical protein
MKEIYDLRVQEKWASLAKLENIGKLLGEVIISPINGKIIVRPIVRQVIISNDDPKIEIVKKIAINLRKKGEFLFTGWSITRKYTKREIAEAVLFHMLPKSFFEPEGEHCGTAYDESKACPKCGAGAEQTSPLRLPLSRIPKSKDFSQTIANEMIVSQRFVALFKSNNFTGATFTPVDSKRRSGAQKTDWHQLQIDSVKADIVPPTLTGLALFELDEKGEYICPNGDLIGLNPLSEFTVSLLSGDTPDIFRARQYLGNRRGVLRPWQPIFVSPRLRNLIVAEKLKGLDFEVAHVR